MVIKQIPYYVYFLHLTPVPVAMAEPLEEFPWESSYQYRCRAGKIREFAPRLGPLKATALANVWANHHFLGQS